MTDIRAEFEAGLGFPLDPFQQQALDALDDGQSVLVAAPTGSGKTIVAEYAVARALAEGAKTFYTTPLKALSNQKFNDLIARHGAGRVGLLTGDNSIRPDAPIVVMTTEVLRNMLYAVSPLLTGLRYVVLDEVHYLQNLYRGAVWEEVIIHSPPEVDLVCLSATVSNAEEFAAWIGTVRGATRAVIEERRPVELQNLFMVGDRSSEQVHLLPTFVDSKPNAAVAQLEARSTVRPHERGRRRLRLYTPRRVDVVDRLYGEEMLPAIYFVFSRAGCDDAVRQCLDAGLRLTTPEERTEIRAIADAKLTALGDADLDALGYAGWMAGLEAGLAAHHAGLVPPFKEAVEAAFTKALVKVVFATETLSLGINMPARTVVIEKITKFTGDGHEPLTPGEYTQLTGRAGRRGIDEQGNAVVLWSPFVPFEQVASLASRRAYALTSSFRPTYNMAANLVRRYQPDMAHHLLNLSFAQYRADSAVVRDEARLDTLRADLVTAEAGAICELGDVIEYAALRRTADRAAKRLPSTQDQVVVALAGLQPGDVLSVPGAKARRRVAVLSTRGRRGGDLRIRVVTQDNRVLTLGPKDFAAPPRAVGRVTLPTPFTPTKPAFQRLVAQSLRQAKLRADGLVGVAGPAATPTPEAEAAAAHPVAGCPDVDEHVLAARRVADLRRSVSRVEQQIHSRTESLARQFDRVLRVLDAWGYVDGWSLTEAGDVLCSTYHEADLLIAEALRVGLLDDLAPEALAALASAFTFEARGKDPAVATPTFPSPRVRERWVAIADLAVELNRTEEDAGLPLTRSPELGFFDLAHGWAAGIELDELLLEHEMSGGDFVRNIKQLIDLLRQLALVAPVPETRAAAAAAAEQLFRGVVAASSVVGGAS
ncbi:MAG TPA: DEAD/DEAH box helicase [Acidimicrobiales bacterium]|nr:DEAD/DEAH box helicase [Acidimicrobiales bacterium]